MANQNNEDRKKKNKKKKSSPKDIVDKKTGLTITPTSNNEEKPKDAKKLEAYNERQAKAKEANKITSVISKSGPYNDAQEEKLYKGSEDVTGVEPSGPQKKVLQQISNDQERVKREKKQAELDAQEDVPSPTGISPKENKKLLKKQKKAQIQTSRELNKKTPDQESSSAILEAMDREILTTAKSPKEINEAMKVKEEVGVELKRKEKSQKKEEKVKTAILKAIKGKVTNGIFNSLAELKPSDLFKMAKESGMKIPGLSKGKGSSARDAYIDTVEKLAVQDYFPQVNKNIGVGTFSGARIGSETIYTGAGALAPMGLYDARRRALKARFGTSQKSIEQLVNFDEVPATYQQSFNKAAIARYNEIMSSDASLQEKNSELFKLETAAKNITYGYNTAKSVRDQIFNPTEGDELFIPKEALTTLTKYIANLNDPKYIEGVLNGDINMAQDAAQIKFYRNLVTDATQFAETMGNFEKELPFNSYINSLSPSQLDNLKTLDPTNVDGVFAKNTMKFFSEDLDKLFDSKFLNDNELVGVYSSDQLEKARDVFKQMLAPSILQDLAEYDGDDGGSGGGLGPNRYVFQEGLKSDEAFFEGLLKSATSTAQIDQVSNVRGVEVKKYSPFNPRGSRNTDADYVAIEESLQVGTDKLSDIASFNTRNEGPLIRVSLSAAGDVKLMTVTEAYRRAQAGTIYSPDFGTEISENDLKNFKDNIAKYQVKISGQVAAPVYYEGNLPKPVKRDLSNQADYNSSSEKGILYQNLGQPLVRETTYSVAAGANVTKDTPLNFIIQGPTYMGTTDKMQEMDSAYTKTGVPERR
jgi:hypothetical protein